MLRALALDDAELSIMLCDDVVMRALNRRYRGYDRTTDVLAFALGEGRRMPVPGPLALGDIVISLPTAARNARIAHKPALAEISLLLAHGLLHLLGCDHRTATEDRRMRARTDLLLAAASLGVRRRPVDRLGSSSKAATFRRAPRRTPSGPKIPAKSKA